MPRKKILILFVLFTGALSFSCKKKAEYTVTGKVTNRNSGEAISGVELDLGYAQVAYGAVSGGYEELGRTSSDAQGRFQFVFEYRSATSFKITARKGGHRFEEKIIEASDWSTDQINEVDIAMYSQAQLSMHFVNDDNPMAQVLLKLDRHSEGCNDCCTSDETFVVNGVADTLIQCNVYGNQVITYAITRIENGNSQRTESEISVKTGENLIEVPF